jgi:hypothetical protein
MDMGAVEASHDSEELPMQTVTTIGFDIAKSVFQVHGVDAAGEVVKRISGPKRFYSSPKKDFFNTIGGTADVAFQAGNVR